MFYGVTVTVTVNKNNNDDRIGSTENPGKKEGRGEGGPRCLSGSWDSRDGRDSRGDVYD